MIKNNITSLAIGSFNSLHLGHLKLFENLDNNGAALAICKKKIPLIHSSCEKKSFKIPFFYYEFDEIRNLNAKEFFTKLKKDFPNLKKIVVGYDFKFGKDRAWQASDIANFFDGEVFIMDEFLINNESVHTSKIVEFIKNGQMKKAKEFLGGYFLICSNCVKGQGLGSKELVSTINLEISDDILLPKSGVYASFTIVNGKKYKSCTFVGNRVSTDGVFSIETHIIEEFFDAANGEVSVLFVEFLRDNFKFSTFSELKNQILLDISKSKELLQNER